ncbi:heavy metal translocating P-type ATPase [Zunongwangia sp. H14]|uniref:heavy metal translocating P-type ATPase n=1 Tax=Zunongwangia sp. H14 TaxID=3240792 RepID=UPI0035625C90
MENCFHCGEECLDETVFYYDKTFCCSGCKTVFEILNSNNLSYYYDLERNPGISPRIREGKFDYLENAEIIDRLLEFDHGSTQIVSFDIPSIHCSSCIWVLENLNKLNKAVKSSQVDFPKKKIRLSFSSEEISLKDLVLLLGGIGYEPNISLDNFEEKQTGLDRSLIYKLGVAGFAFGNVMFLSFPEYFNLSAGQAEVQEFWLDQFKFLFRWLMFGFSLPVVFYSGWDYFVSAYKGLRAKMLNIDVPIALGIAVLFIRSSAEIILNLGAGFFDSLTGLVFFLLLGRFFQQKTYAYLSFERDYKSYFPIAVTRISSEENKLKEEQVQVYDIKKGDRIVIRNEELIPMDAILIKGNALIDYSFVTGEADPVAKAGGDKIYAGGRQQGGIIEIEALKPVKQSYLTQLWSDEVFSKDKRSAFQSLTNRISKKFTTAVLAIAFLSALFWLIYDPSKALNVFTAVLIIACPCAIALAAPFTLGNLLRIFGKNKFYIKEAAVIEQMAQIDTIVFDKTGTITCNSKNTISYEGVELSPAEEEILGSSFRASGHPLSRALYELLKKHNISTPDEFKEITGKGIESRYKGIQMKIGSEAFVKEKSTVSTLEKPNKTAVHICSNNSYKGCYVFQNTYRKEVSALFEDLGKNKNLVILSGDNDGEKENLQKLLPHNTQLFFNQKPKDKLTFIKNLQQQGKKVMMVGDGLNDAGALAQSHVGIVISENINVFSPACDGILDASEFGNFSRFLQLSAKGIKVIKWSFLLSLCYNIIGISFAISGHLAPVVAAILMPLSSISIVLFTSFMTYLLGKKLNRFK